MNNIKEGNYYASGDSIVKIHKIHRARRVGNGGMSPEFLIDFTLYAPGGGTHYTQAMPLTMMKTLVPVDSYLVGVLFS